MKTLLLLLLGMLLPGVAAYAQSPARYQPEVGLKDRTVIRATTLEKKTPMLKKPFLLLDDSVRIEMSQVDYYQTESAHFVIRSLGPLAGEHEMERLEAGRINVYSLIVTTYTAPTPGQYGAMYGGGHRTTVRYYFEKDGGPLQFMSKANLKQALMGHELAMQEFNKVAKWRAAKIGLWVVGGGLAAAGFSQMINEMHDGNDSETVNGLLVTGVVLMVIPNFMSFRSADRTLNAVRIYNSTTKVSE